MARDLLDLHGCTVDEVIGRLDPFLLQASNAGLKRARVMTGKGTGKVKAEVLKYLKQAHYQWKYEKLSNGKDNEGVLVVFLD